MPKSKGAKDPAVAKMRRQFAERLAAELDRPRPEKPIKKVDLARAIGISKSTVNSYLAGRALPTGENLIALSTFLEVSVSYLLPTGFTRRTSIEKQGEELGARIGLGLLERLLAIPAQRLRRELHGVVGMIEDEKRRAVH